MRICLARWFIAPTPSHRSTLAFAVMLATLAGAACSGDPPGDPPAQPTAVSAGPPAENPFIEVSPAATAGQGFGMPLPGTLVFHTLGLAAVASPVEARIVSIETRPGVTVQKGDPLVTLESSEVAKARAELLEAEAKAAAAEELLRRQKDLVAKGVGLEVERFEAETAAREARAELERARRMAALVGKGKGDRFTLESPASGVIVSLRAKVGAAVSPGDPALAEIGDPAAVWVQAEVPESSILEIHPGLRASVRISAADESFDAVVDGIGGQVEGEQRRVAVYLRPLTPTQGLVAGMLAEVRLSLDGEGSTISLPVEAVLIKKGSERVVYVQAADGRYEPREVRTGVSRDGRVPILEGLQAGEKVVVRGALLLDAQAEQLL